MFSSLFSLLVAPPEIFGQDAPWLKEAEAARESAKTNLLEGFKGL